MDVHQSLEAAAARKSSSKSNARNNLASDNAALCISLISKENLSPCVAGSPPFAYTSSKIRPPLRSNSVIGNQPESFPGKCVLDLMNSLSSSSATSLASQEPRSDDVGVADLGNIDSEIESIEKEIGRLTLRLEYLRLEKVKRISAKWAAALKRGRFVPAKFMDPPLPPSTGKINPRKIDESKSAKQKTPLGRKAISLGPAEIYSATKSRKPPNRQEITPVYQSQSRRKSCFWKLQEVDEHKVMKERGKTSVSMTLSPKLRESASKLQAVNSKQAVTTLRASKYRSVKKEDESISSIQPKELFKDGDKSEAAKKPLRCGRVVASRYKCSNGDSTTPNGSRKRSLPDNDQESKTFNRKRISLSINPETE